jgi:hypothetical protein
MTGGRDESGSDEKRAFRMTFDDDGGIGDVAIGEVAIGDVAIGEVAQCRSLFGALADGQMDAFLSRCVEGIELHAHGCEPEATVIPGQALAAWFTGRTAPDGGELAVRVRSASGLPGGGIVHLVHTFDRGGLQRSWETVNVCSFRDGRLSRWASYAVDLDELVGAWSDVPIGGPLVS